MNKLLFYHWFVSVCVDSFNVEEDRFHFTACEKKTKQQRKVVIIKKGRHGAVDT